MSEPGKIRVCVIDDEPIAVRKVQRLLREDPEIEIVALCTNGTQSVEAIQGLSPDLIFLDIQMPEMDGFEVLAALDGETLPYVIFVTAYNHHAIRAFEVHALDYLLKPFDRARFFEALNRAKYRIRDDREKPRKDDLQLLLKEISNNEQYLDWLVIKEQGKILLIKTDDIDWIEAQGKYEMIHVNRQNYLIREGMGKLEAELNPRKFVRIHKSTIVNIERIQHLEPLFHANFRVTLRNGTTLTISRRYRDKLEKLLRKSL